MVYTGQPSHGCATCRKRRIKCDEALPQCGACVRVKQTCPGYKNHFDLAWRDQTTVAKKGVERGKAKRKAAREREEAAARAKSKASYIQVSDSQDGGSSSVASSNSPGNVFTPQSHHSSISSRSQSPHAVQDFSVTPLYQDPYDTVLRPIPQEQALCFFFNNYVFPIRDPLARRGFLEYLAPFYMNSSPGSPVYLSTMAVATCLMSSRMGLPPDAPLPRSFYTRAVSSIKDMLASQRDCTTDDFIAAVMLLQFYEATTGQLRRRSDTKQPHPHLDGALALIRHRKPSNFNSPVSKSILLYVRSLLIEQAFRSALPVPSDVQTWGDYVPESEQIPGFRLDSINLDLANLQASAFSIIRSKATPLRSNQFLNAYREAMDIDRRLFDWSQSVPDSWVPHRIFRDDNTSPGLQFYQDYCDVYSTLFLTSIWNRLRLSQIEVNFTMISCLTELPPTASNLANQDICRQTIQRLADDICASVPFYLGDRIKPGRTGDGCVQYPRVPGRPPVKDHYHTGPTMGGWTLLIPLGTLNRMNIPLRDGQRGWIAGQMARAARIYNIRLPGGPPKR